jgi:hypothetical protein
VNRTTRVRYNIDNKIVKITGIINNTFKPNRVQKGTQIKLYTILALPVLLCGSETWTVKSKDKSKLTAAEMRFIRRLQNIHGGITKPMKK